jgi:hypothetical protein
MQRVSEPSLFSSIAYNEVASPYRITTSISMQGLPTPTPTSVISMQSLPTPTSVISMQSLPTPTEDDEGPNLNRSVIVRRRAAKRTLPWDLPADELELVSPPQAEDTQATKKLRLERPFPTSADEAATKNMSHDTEVALPDAAASVDHDHADSDLLTSGEALPVAESTSEENFPSQQQPTSVDGDASSQNSGVPPGQQPQYPIHPHPPQPQMQMPYGMLPQGNYYGGQMPMHPSQQRGPTGPHPGYHPGQYMYMPPQQMPGPGMYQRQMYSSMPNIPPTMMLGPGGMPYYPGQGGQIPYRAAATMLVPGQRLHFSIDPTSARVGRWTPDEITKLKDAVLTHNGKNWGAITALVPGRTKRLCQTRWSNAVDPRIVQTTGRTGNWTPDEDDKLKVSVRIHDRTNRNYSKNWDAIAAFVPGRTKRQCRKRWSYAVDPRLGVRGIGHRT